MVGISVNLVDFVNVWSHRDRIHDRNVSPVGDPGCRFQVHEVHGPFLTCSEERSGMRVRGGFEVSEPSALCVNMRGVVGSEPVGHGREDSALTVAGSPLKS